VAAGEEAKNGDLRRQVKELEDELKDEEAEVGEIEEKISSAEQDFEKNLKSAIDAAGGEGF